MKMYLHNKNEVSTGKGFSKLEVEQDRHADADATET